MIKVNKNLLHFLLPAFILGGSILLVLNRFLPLFLKHSVYYCQQFIHSFSFQIPHQTGLFIVGVILVVLIGAVTKLFIAFLQVKRLRIHLEKYKKQKHTFVDLVKKLELENKVYVIKSQKMLAFCFGIRDPKIYLSTALLSIMNQKEIEAILLHEKYHLENKDNFILLFAHVTKILFPFFPVLSDLLTQYRIGREIEADRRAIRNLGDSTPMVSVLRKLLSTSMPVTLPVSALADFDTLEPRITAIVGNKKNARKFSKTNLAISFLSLGIIAAFAITPVQAVEMQGMNGKENTTMLCLQGDMCASWCKAHKTVIPSTVNVSYPYSSAK